MVNHKELNNYCHDYLNVAAFEDYCPNGLQVEGVETINKIVSGVSANFLLKEKEDIVANANIIINERQRLFDVLTSISSLKVFPSQTNFLLIKVDDAKSLFEFLKANGILVKSFDMNPQLSNCIRVTVGNPSENNEFLEQIKSYYG